MEGVHKDKETQDYQYANIQIFDNNYEFVNLIFDQLEFVFIINFRFNIQFDLVFKS